MNASEGNLLLKLARESIAECFGGPKVVKPPKSGFLDQPGAVFVTLRDPHGELRGCIGSIQAHRRLFDDLTHNAKAAAFDDPRMTPVTPEELGSLHIEVSVLSELEPLEVSDEEDALRKMRPEVDGIELSALGRRAVFIPKIWEQLPEPREFLYSLKRKAGLPNQWVPGTRLRRFTAESFGEPEKS